MWHRLKLKIKRFLVVNASTTFADDNAAFCQISLTSFKWSYKCTATSLKNTIRTCIWPVCLSPFCLQCFDAIGWAAGRTSGLWKTEWWGAGMVICLERSADLHMAQLMPLPLTVSCFNKIQIGFTCLVLAHPGSPGKRAVKWVCVCVSTAPLKLRPYGAIQICLLLLLLTGMWANH